MPGKIADSSLFSWRSTEPRLFLFMCLSFAAFGTCILSVFVVIRAARPAGLLLSDVVYLKGGVPFARPRDDPSAERRITIEQYRQEMKTEHWCLGLSLFAVPCWIAGFFALLGGAMAANSRQQVNLGDT